METIRYLIKASLKIAFAFFFTAFIWMVMSIFFPALSLKTIVPNFGQSSTSTKATHDWLPSPKRYSGLISQKLINGNYGTLYAPGDAYAGYDLRNSPYKYSTSNFVSYTSADGSTIVDDTSHPVIHSPKTDVQTPVNVSVRGSLVRNLSIYEKGHVYTGLAFIGEAKNTMFRNGAFPIVVVDNTGKVVGVSAAHATDVWTTPGWVRFETKIEYTLPVNVPCTMVFEEALTQTEKTRQPVRVPMPVQCN